MRHRKIGIDLGHNSIRMVALKETGQEVNLANINSVVVEHKKEYFISYSSRRQYISQLKSAIKDFSKIIGSKFLSINFSISDHEPDILTNIMDLPNLNRELLNQSIENEMQESTDFNIKDYQTQWRVLKEDNINNALTILAVAIHKETVAQLEAVGTIFWKIERIEPQLFTIEKFIKGNSIIIDLGFAEIITYSYRQGNIINLSHLKVEEDDLKAFRELNEEGKKLFIENIKNPNMSLRRVIDKVILDVRDLVRSIEISNRIDFDKAYITGGLSQVAYMDKDLSISLDIDTEILDIKRLIQQHKNIDINKSQDTEEKQEEEDFHIDSIILGVDKPEEKKKKGKKEEKKIKKPPRSIREPQEDKDSISGLFMYAIGVLIYSQKAVNFSYKRKIALDSTAIMAGLLALVLALNLGLVILSKSYDKLIAQSQHEIEEASQIKEELAATSEKEIQEVTDIENKYKAIVQLKKQKNWLSDMLYTLEKETPKGVALQNIDIYDETSTITGYAIDYKNIGYLGISLEKYGDIDIEEVDLLNQDIYKLKDGKNLNKKFIITLKHGQTSLSTNRHTIGD